MEVQLQNHMSITEEDTKRPTNTCWPVCSRSVLFFLGSGAITLSVFSLYSCEFFSYRSLNTEAWEGLSPPFDELASGSVGLFRYSKTSSETGIFGEECIQYDDWSEIGQSRFFFVAQCCTLTAPLVGLLGLLQIVCECWMCRLKGSYAISRFFFVLASTLQMCSFFAFGDTQFCLDAASENQCRLEKGAYYSLGSVGGYLLGGIATILLQPYKDANTFLFCCISTRRPKQRLIEPDNDNSSKKNKAHQEGGDTATEDDGEPKRYDEESNDNSSYFPESLSNQPNDGDNETMTMDDNSQNERRVVQGTEDVMTTNHDSQSMDDGSKMDRSVAEAQVGQGGGNNDNDEDNDNVEDLTNTNENGSKRNNNSTKESEDTLQANGSLCHDLAEIVANETHESENTKSPDFLDMCCGDPLELEKYLGRQQKGVDPTPTTTVVNSLEGGGGGGGGVVPN